MSGSGLTCEAQVRYILQWFKEFSELQKEDFLPVMKAARGGNQDDLASALDALSCEDKPISLFQCRLKLFNEWYPNWSTEEQERLITGITNIDKDFAEKLQELLSNPQIPSAPMNGTANGTTNGTHILENGCEDEEPEKVSDIEEPNNSDDTKDDEIPNLETVNDNIPLEIAAAS